MERRPVDILVLSDIHLGTVGCHAKELHEYLSSIDPGLIILNGDIIDIWQFRKNYWPASHMKVVKKFLSWLSKGKTIYYLTGNHDELLRKFSPTRLGNLHIKNKLLLQTEGGPAWFFHGDVFDLSMKYSKWLARLGAVGYDLLILINRFVNQVAAALGYGRISLSKKIKDGVKTAVRFISDFEQIAIDLAAEKGYSYVVCGHIHQPNIREITLETGKLTYLNSGDWIENLTALEYHDGQWQLYRHPDEKAASKASSGGGQHSSNPKASELASSEEPEGVSLETEMLHGTGQPEEEVSLAQLIQQVSVLGR